MSVCVIDDLEVVEIEDEQLQRAARPLEQPLQPQLKGVAVGQAGQRIGGGLSVQVGGLLTLHGDVLRHAAPAAVLPLNVEQGGAAELPPGQPLGREQRQFDAAKRVGLAQGGAPALRCRFGLRAQQPVGRCQIGLQQVDQRALLQRRARLPEPARQPLGHTGAAPGPVRLPHPVAGLALEVAEQHPHRAPFELDLRTRTAQVVEQLGGGTHRGQHHPDKHQQQHAGDAVDRPGHLPQRQRRTGRIGQQPGGTGVRHHRQAQRTGGHGTDGHHAQQETPVRIGLREQQQAGQPAAQAEGNPPDADPAGHAPPFVGGPAHPQQVPRLQPEPHAQQRRHQQQQPRQQGSAAAPPLPEQGRHGGQVGQLGDRDELQRHLQLLQLTPAGHLFSGRCPDRPCACSAPRHRTSPSIFHA